MRIFFSLLFACIAGIIQASLISALPFPFSTLNLPLMMIVLAITHFAFRRAYIYAFVSGCIVDLLSPHPFGMALIALLIVTAIFIFICTRVVTHLSFIGTITFSAGSFFLYHLIFTAMAGVLNTFSTNTGLTLLWRQRFFWILLGIMTQTIIAMLFTYGSERSKKFFHTIFFTNS